MSDLPPDPIKKLEAELARIQEAAKRLRGELDAAQEEARKQLGFPTDESPKGSDLGES